MTTLAVFQKIKKNNLLLIILLFSSSFLSYSQIDSVDVNLNFTVETDSTILDSLGNYSIIDVINVNATINDVDFLGEVLVTVYDSSLDYPIAMIKMTAQQIIDANQKVGSVVTVKLDGIDPSGSYRVETQVRNFQGANFPMVTTNYN
jgi:hypothetical protein